MNARYLIAGVAAVYILACTATTRTLSWEDTSQNEEGFRIYRVVGNEQKIIAEVGPNVTQYVDRNAPPNACYIITAFMPWVSLRRAMLSVEPVHRPRHYIEPANRDCAYEFLLAEGRRFAAILFTPKQHTKPQGRSFYGR
jgi:hypothetical protein